MSGDALRSAAQQGDDKFIRTILKDRTNPCSADNFGLTALHYAVWNGHTDRHIECIKWLVCNHMGINKEGSKVTSLNLRSCKGYTALHLACLDAPKWNAKQIVTLLLISGCDRDIADNDGYSALDLADENANVGALEAFNEFDSQDTISEEFNIPTPEKGSENNSQTSSQVSSPVPTRNVSPKISPRNDDTNEKNPKITPNKFLKINPIKKKLNELKGELKVKYTFSSDDQVQWDAVIKVPKKAQFEIPSFIHEKQRTGYVPKGMEIHEQFITPLTNEGYNLEGVPALYTLEYTKGQALINQHRRELLVSRGNPEWKPIRLEEKEKELRTLRETGKQKAKRGKNDSFIENDDKEICDRMAQSKISDKATTKPEK